MNNYRTIQQKDMHNFFLSQEKNIPSLGTKISQPVNKTGLRFALSLLLMFVIGINTAWGLGPVEITTDADGNGTIEDSEKKFYLIQTSQFQSFYMAPQNNTVTTNNILGDYMLWYFLDAGTDGDIQYYYIVNNRTENNYIYNYSDRKIQLTNFASLSDENKEKCKFKIVLNETNGTTGFYNINIKGRSGTDYYGLNKQNGSETNSNNPIRLTNDAYINDVNSKWKFVPFNGTYVWPTPPFTPSTDSDKHFYKISNVSNNGYYVSTDATPDKVTYASTESDRMIWYLKEASSDSWFKYYYIINPSTGGRYMYYKGTATNGSNQTNAVSVEEYDSANEDRYQFAVIQAAKGDWPIGKTDGRVECYAIIPKLLTDKLWGSNSIGLGSISDGANMGIISSRGSNNNAQWKFEVTDYSTECATPTITFSNTTGKVTITTTTSNPSIYYTTNGTEPSSTNGSTLYVGPFDVTEETTIMAIVTRDGFTDSEVTTETFYQVTTPTIQNNGPNAVSITSATEGATIYYTTNGDDPTTSSTEYTAPLTENISGVTIKAIAVKDGMINSAIGSGSVTLSCATPVFTRNENNLTISCPFPATGVSIYYTKNGGEPTTSSTLYTGAISVNIDDVIKAIAVAEGYNNSEVATKTVYDELQPIDGKYYINDQTDFVKFVDMANSTQGAAYHYILKTNVDAGSPITVPFTGVFEVAADESGNFYTITGLTHPLFNTIDGGVVKNAIFSEVDVKGNGTICNEASGATKIYNCGVLSGTVTGSGNVGGLVGHITSSSSVRVINCYNFAKVIGGSIMGGIVGNNEGTVGDVRIAMCMMYGDMPGGTSPVYAGNHTSNASNFTEYNYWRSKANLSFTTYNDQLAIDNDEYLTRFPFYRHILNTHRELAAYFLFANNTTEGSVSDITAAQVEEIGHWSINKSKAIYPIIEKWEKNTKKVLDAPSGTTVSVRKGDGTPITSLKVKVIIGAKTYTTFPGTETELTLPITDMDEENYDYTWGKVVLPFANEFEVNTDYSKICTGWKITGITGGNGATYSNYNMSDRECTDKDLYSNTGFIFAQGGYYIVPYNVTKIEITANFANAFYLSDESYDISYSGDNTTAGYKDRTGLGGDTPTTYHGKTVYHTLAAALGAIETAVGSNSTTGTTHEQAVVLVGNYHQDEGTLKTANGYTIMSIDADNNQEPDYAIYSNYTTDRPAIPPTRFDFVAMIPVGMSAHVTNSKFYPNIPIFKPRGWFELTETSLLRADQFELDSNNFNTSANDTKNYRCIINGGYFTQMVRSNQTSCTKVSYFQIGGKAYVKEFYPGNHSKKSAANMLVPVNVTGGEIEQCFMTGYGLGTAYGRDIYFWCAGGKIGKFLGAYMEKPKQSTNADGNVNLTAKIDHAIIGRFFGGGTSPSARVTGNINVTIDNSRVDFYCGGPEFGDMTSGKTVKTEATNTYFKEYYGAGFGGTGITYTNDKDTGEDLKNKNTFSYNTGYFDECYVAAGKIDIGRLRYKSNYGIGSCYKFEFVMHSRGYQAVSRFFTGYARFSLASTGNVTNILNGCEIEKDFYGAGCQGKVNGTVTSTLTGCTVHGSAFGGGYKAESNQVDVYPATSPTLSTYNSETCLFTDFGTIAPETYEWVQGTSAKNNTVEGNKLYTGTDVTLTDLGNVTGAISLTIDGGSVTENVYGGGNESKSLDNTTVAIENGAQITGNVYGGGNLANVEGNTQVNITGGTIAENVFGGGKGEADEFSCSKAMVGDNNAGAGADLTTEENKNRGTKVTISNGTVNGNVYGGGEVGRVEWNTQVTIGAVSGGGTPIVNGSVFGAGAGVATHGYAALVRGNSTVTIQGKAKVLQNVYGGGEQATVGRYWVKGINNVDSEGNPIPSAPSAPTDMPDEMPYKTMSGGKCTVVVQGSAQVGPDSNVPITAGHVFGAGKGVTPNYVHTGDKAKWSKRMVDYNSTKHTSEGKGTAWDYYEDYTEDQIADTNFPKYVWEYFVDDDQSAANYKSGEDKYLEFLQTLALVTGTDVTIGGGTVKGSVFGGSESGYVQDDTDVKVNGGTIGTTDLGGAYYGNVYGGGKGDAEHTGTNQNYVAAGLVKGNTKVTISNGTILHNIYGGGAYGSVGEFIYDNTGMPTGLQPNTTGGKTEIYITGGTIGTTGKENGMIFGSSRGDVGASGSIHDKLAWVYDTHVAIGDTTENATITTAAPLIRGSIYGGGENGHNFHNSYVRINGGTVGISDTSIDGGAEYAYRGNVYGGGCGTDKYDNNTKYNPKAGIVQGNAFVNMTAGHVVRNVYGAGAMGSVGTDTSGGKTTVSVSGGRIGYDGYCNNDGNIFGAARGDLAATGDNLAQVRETEVNISYTTTPSADNNEKTVQLIAGSVFGGGEAGKVKESVAVNMTGGLVLKDVYGGGAKAHTQTSNWDATANNNAGGWADADKKSTLHTTTVRLTGGTVLGEAYGGGLGIVAEDAAAYVYGDVLLDLNGTTSSGETGTRIESSQRGCAVNYVFGCNNALGTPKGNVLVHIYATQNKEKETIAQKYVLDNESLEKLSESETDEAYVTRLKRILSDKITIAEALNIVVSDDYKTLCTSDQATAENLKTAITAITTSVSTKDTENDKKIINGHRYDVVAVYGGGNEAAYNPVSPYTDSNTTGTKSKVIIEGCDYTSIETVYGGGNAAAVPETNVEIKEAYEIQAIFGGGNGKDKKSDGSDNPGADIGTLDQGSSTYGTGNANSVLKGGFIHEAYGGSNTKGIVKGNLNQTSEPNTGEGACELILEKIVGAGKYADIDGDVNMTLSCQPSTKVPLLFAGADEANVNGNITLNITNGHFGKVFGGNNLGGAVKGKITVNVEETGCQPIRIDELYLGGNEAAYSVYGYYESDEVHPVTEKKILKPRTSATDPNLPVKHDGTNYASIDAFPNYAQPELNIISCTYIGKVFGGGYGEGAKMYADPTVNINMIQGTATGSLSGIGAIGDVYGGGNAAKIIGNTTVNIGTDANVLGANITGNVYGGGNLADVTGNTYVNICAVENDDPLTTDVVEYTSVTPGTAGVSIAGNVYGGGKGVAKEEWDANAFFCAEAMVGVDGTNSVDNNNSSTYADNGTHVRIGNGTVVGSVYGGGEIGRVEFHTEVVIGLGEGTGAATKSPIINGSVFGAGKGTNTHGYSGLVRGDSRVTIQGDAKVGHSVYGGGEMASVGKYQLDANGLPKTPVFGGKCTVTIQGYAEIGPDNMQMTKAGGPDDTGHVFGAGKGTLPYENVTGTPWSMELSSKVTYDESKESDYYKFIQSLGLASNSDVTIGGHAFVKGSVYGGSENGYLQANTHVTIAGGQIGEGLGETAPYDDADFIDPSETPVTTGLATCATWTYDKTTTGNPYDKYAGTAGYDAKGGATTATDGHTYYGNVFGGGRGVVPFAAGKWHRAAGSVAGNTQVDITGGHILSSVYGGNEHTDVGSYALGTDGEPTTTLSSGGTCTINITGGTVGVPRTKEQIEDNPVIGNVFGAGKGDKRVLFNTWTNVGATSVNISGTAKIYGSVFGGGEDGHVIGNAVSIIGGTVTTGVVGNTTEHAYSKVVIGSTGISGADGNVFGGGRGSETALTAGVVGGNVNLTIDNGNILGSVYGGGRLASVGTNFTNPTLENGDPDPLYGQLQTPDADHGNINVIINGGTIGQSNSTGVNGNIFGGSKGTTTNFLLGIARSTTINMTGGTAYASVYGGGELAQVVGSHTTGGQALGTEINISGGTIGTEKSNLPPGTTYGATYGNVYGGGKGNTTNVEAGLIKTNTKVSISQASGKTTLIRHNIYGGGAYGSVGTYTYYSETTEYATEYAKYKADGTAPDAEKLAALEAKKNDITGWTSGGKAMIAISGGTIGEDGHENGMIFGSSRGDVGAPGEIHDKLAWVYDTEVTVNDGQINGSIYGGGENGHVYHDAAVNVHGGTIGSSEDPNYAYRGNVYGGGCGTDKYYTNTTGVANPQDGNGDKYNPLAGIVYGDATVLIDGGHVVHNVYGAGAMGSVGTASVATSGKTTVTVSGGRIGYDGSNNGNVYGAARGDLAATGDNLAQVRETEVNINYTTTPAADNNEKTVQLIAGSVFGGGEAGTVKESVAVNMTGGLVLKDVYGGGALADTQTSNWDATNNTWASGMVDANGRTTYKTNVNLLGGTIGGDAYGGGLGRLAKEAVAAQPAQGTEGQPDYVPAVEAQAAVSAVEAKVYGDVAITLGDAGKTNATAFNISNYTGDHADVIKSGRVFGCNNLNGSPKGNVTVTAYKTVCRNTDGSPKAKPTIDNNTYEVAAVYGGGNLADYTPAGTDKKTIVRIMTCDVSVQEVYGGGNAAAVPETDVLINGAYEIDQVFGGGNGEDSYYLNEEWHTNPGANVGGNATTLLKGGYIHEAYGGSNSKGTITGNINISKGTGGDCTLNVVELYGAGKDADVEGDLIMVMGCSDTRTERVYGCAKNANIKGNVELTITSGEYGKVFGGNNESGAIFGHIVINVEETGCTPIIIDELYGCGNDAAYSTYGYWQDGTIEGTDGKPKYVARTSADDEHAAVTFEDKPHTTPPYADPEVNIISCTRIGKVFGGGYGAGATVYGNPKVNINQIYGIKSDGNGDYITATELGRIGVDANGSSDGCGVFGGGNQAKVVGNTTVNIGTETTVQLHVSYDTTNGYSMSDAKPILGANILSNVYGGGNLADVTGNTFVNICAEYDNETEKFVAVAEGISRVTIGGNVFGGGKGEAAESGDDAFLCARAMIGENDLGANPDYPNGNTSVRIGNGTVNGNVYGGGMVGRVEKNTMVTIGLEGTPISKPEIIGNVYGGGQGEKHHGYAGLVRGNPTVTIQGNAKVRKSVYGGGEIASVARYKVAADETEAAAHGVEVGMPYVLANANSGKCTVTIQGNAEIGPDYQMKMYHPDITDGTDKPDDFGHVFGAGKGILPEVFTYADDNNKPYRIANNGEKEYYTNEDGYFAFIQTLALSTETHVTIDGNAFVKGSVYGGSENGLVQYDTNVTINSGQIGCGDGVDHRYIESDWNSESLAECAHWDYGLDTNNDGKKDLFAPYDPNANATGDLDKYPKVDAQSEAKSTEGGRRIATDGHTYYGNVFGGGSGSVPYFDTQQGISRYIPTAGEVKGNTHVTINGGHILTNVYGGNEATNVLGTAHVTMTGGTVGVPRTAEQIKNHPVTCYVFGAGKGDQRIFFNKETNVNDAVVTITGGRIYGSVFGGGEDGHVLRNTTVTIGDNGTGPTIGTTGTTYVDGNVFGGGRGFGGDALTAGNVGGAVDLTINGGTMLGSIYGGGRLASVGYGLYLVNEVVDGVKPYGVMREDNQYDGSYPNPSTEAASDFYNKGRGHITITINGGTIGKEFESETEGAEHSGNVFGGSMGRLTKLDGTPFDANHWKLLATAKSATINVTSGTIKRNVYGGGEMGTVTTNTTVNISGGTIGTTGKGADNYGNVYGGGKGLETEILAGIVKGNSNVTISDGTILHNVYGGGAYGSVGTFTISDDMRTFTWGDPYNNTGVSSVTISGGTIGEDALNGNVFGGGRGVANTFWCEKGIAYKANVIISNGTVKGNVYGGGEVGRVETDTKVEIGSGTGEGTFAPSITGSVFGGGAGLETHGYSALVRGNTTVTIEGNAHVGNSVYGGGEIASVGKYGLDANEMPSILKGGGQCTVTVQGNASIGTDVFGAGKGVSPHFDKDNEDETKRSRRMIVNEDNYVWDYFQNESDYLTYLTTLALATHPNVTINENATVGRSVFGGGEVGLTKGSVEVNISGGTIHEDVYGGGALADTNTTTIADLNDDGQIEPVSPTTTVNLTGGLIKGDAYGGGLGQKNGFNGGNSDIEATVYGDITVNLGGAEVATATAFNINYENTGEKDEANNPIMVVQSGRVFGCNNLNGSPQGNVTVNVYKTVEGNVKRTAAEDPNAQEKRASRDANVSHTYELAAVYGGGNLANYTVSGKKANVVIHTCDVSVQYVYGGGNAAAVPGTDVLVKGAWEIDHVFGGGNGKDMYKKGNEWILNAGADVTGNTNTLLIGGYIHEAYGGSNEKGTISGNVTINTKANDPACVCDLDLEKLYGAGKNADIEGDLIVVLDCAPETKTAEIYGGAENANVKGNVELTITSGSFGKVFGGNNQSGAIFGHIILNVEETSCRPIIIDELYGCGNNAAYSVYGYKDGGTDADGYPIYIPRTSKDDGTPVTFAELPHTVLNNTKPQYNDPELNIISCTSIGQVFGGGLGSGATVYGNPTVNINQIPGAFAAQIDRDGEDGADNNSNALGEIGDVFGGGNEANVVGNTNVNIGTKDKVKLHLSVDGKGTYTYSEDKTVLGANITGNVYGGGNEAEVTGNTNVTIGK